MTFLKALLIVTLFSFSNMAGATSCPTCPKGYAISRLEEALVPQRNQKDVGRKAKSSGYALSLDPTKVTSLKKTPIQNAISPTKSSAIVFKPGMSSKRSLEDIREEQNRTQRLMQPPFQSLEGIVRQQLNWSYDKKRSR